MSKTSVVVPDAFFQEIPKVDIHCHLYGTIRESTLKEFACASNAPLSQSEIGDFYVRGEKPRGVLHAFRFMEEFILDSADRLYRLTYECLEDMAAETVRYTELFWNSTGTLKHHPGLSFELAQSAITKAMSDAGIAFGIESRLIHAIDRQAQAEDAVSMVELMMRHRDPLAVGMGIDYLETDHPPEGFWKSFQMAREAGFRTTAHAGEFGCHWRNIETAIKLLQVDRLDHCYTILDNEDLIQECIARDLVITVVPTNSYYMRTLAREKWADKHPIRQMARRGLRIHPNTDDPTFHNITPALVWKMMHEDFGYSLQDLRSFMVNGLDGAWIDADRRRLWKAEQLAGFDAALSRHKLIAA
ncbi:MAG: adenosine deaminase [Alphaproteobacteria bacterium]|nr:adenosine deaminase [Alphaproteobacteria bacterium]